MLSLFLFTKLHIGTENNGGIPTPLIIIDTFMDAKIYPRHRLEAMGTKIIIFHCFPSEKISDRKFINAIDIK